MRRMKVLVTLDALHKQPTEVAFWELPILRHMHGDASVVEQGEMRCNQRVPDPEMEHIRLEKRYGVNKDTRVPRVVEIYGAGATGVQRLAEAMREDLEEQARFDEEAAREAKKEEIAADVVGKLGEGGAADPVAAAVVEERKRNSGTKRSASA